MGLKTSVYLSEETKAAVEKDGRSLHELIRAGLGTHHDHVHQCSCGDTWQPLRMIEFRQSEDDSVVLPQAQIGRRLPVVYPVSITSTDAEEEAVAESWAKERGQTELGPPYARKDPEQLAAEEDWRRFVSNHRCHSGCIPGSHPPAPGEYDA